jgi:hypothetical protein
MSMSMERFKRLLDAYGADARRWPEADWTRAQSLLSSSPEARTAWSRAASLDSLLDHHPAGTGDDAVERCFDRIVAEVDRRQAAPRAMPAPLLSRLASSTAPRASFFAVVAVLGFLFGLSGWGEPVSTASADTLSITYGGDFGL